MIFGTALLLMRSYAGTDRGPIWRRSYHCWPPIWGTSQSSPPTITYTGSSRSEPPPVKDSPTTTAGWLCPYLARKDGSDEDTKSQSAWCRGARLLPGLSSPPSWNQSAYYPQLPRQHCAAPAVSLHPPATATGETRLCGSGSTRHPLVSLLPFT